MPLRVEREPVIVHGSLAYVPGEDWNRIWVLVPALAGVAGLALLYRAVRRERRGRRD